ncbi:MAG: hypothetical protein E6I80_09495 [Chloroflexi bacterium]|nr:MAG: hypothetical protein E6I80_09495 [Chloroflexota bacterium]
MTFGPTNGAACHVEPINVSTPTPACATFRIPPHERSSSAYPSGRGVSGHANAIDTAQEKSPRWSAAGPRTFLLLLTLRGQCSLVT